MPRRIILTVRQIRALNAISVSKNVPPRYSENAAASNSVQGSDDHNVSSVSSVHQLSRTDVCLRHYQRLMRELRQHGYVAEAGVPISSVQEPDTTTNNETSTSSSSSDNDDDDDDGETVGSSTSDTSSSDASSSEHSSSSAAGSSSDTHDADAISAR